MDNVIDLEEYKRLRVKKEYWAKVKRMISEGKICSPAKIQFEIERALHD